MSRAKRRYPRAAVARKRPARDSALIAVLREESGAAADAEVGERPEEERQKDEEEVAHPGTGFGSSLQSESPGFAW
mgnify:CR=1 FL=1